MIMLNNNLRIFMVAAELKSVTEAAKKLYVSQPAVSHAIKKIEEELGVKLFIRNKRSKLTLTGAGNDILGLAYRMSDLENKLYQRAYEESHLMGGIVRIASVPLATSIILSRALPVYRQHFPAVEVELLEGSPLEVKNMVLNYHADIGISTAPYLGMEHKPLLKDRMVSICKNESVDVDLRKSNANLILCRVARDSILEQMAGQSIDLSHCMTVYAASTQINMVENGNGIGIISELMHSTISNELVLGSVIPKMEMEISL
ncbi:MAG: LysR family transcriptional regulator, partial [Mailhella sp.]|nr:LysR family transcriptional regulator [Mailhella sp.]